MRILIILLLPLTALATTLEAGDWIFRAGTGQESAIIRTASNSKYSHIGVILTADPITILHATTNDDPTHPNQVIISTYEDFTAPEMAATIAIYRPIFLNEAEKLAILEQLKQQLGKPFRLTTQTNHPRYCTTILYDAIKTVRPDFTLTWQHSYFPLFKGAYLPPEAFLRSPYPITLIKQFSPKNSHQKINKNL